MRFSALTALAALASAVAAIDTITVKDRHFVYKSSGKPFFVSAGLACAELVR